MSDPSDPLDPLLNRWAEAPPPAADLRAEVWRRIARAESHARDAGGFWAEISGWLVRPPFAALFVTSCALLGLFLAQVRVTRQEREHSVQLARSYLQLIDPLLKPEAVVKRR